MSQVQPQGPPASNARPGWAVGLIVAAILLTILALTVLRYVRNATDVTGDGHMTALLCGVGLPLVLSAASGIAALIVGRLRMRIVMQRFQAGKGDYVRKNSEEKYRDRVAHYQRIITLLENAK